jgi:hypothetical protein
MLFDTFRISFLISKGFSKSGNPDVLKLFHRHSVWLIRISVLVKVNCILVKVIGIQHYSFIDLIVPCFSQNCSLRDLIMLADWHISLHACGYVVQLLNTWSWFRSNFVLPLPLNGACLIEKQQIPLFWYLVRPERG